MLINVFFFSAISVAGLFLSTRTYHIVALVTAIILFLTSNGMVELTNEEKLYPLVGMLGYALTSVPIGLGKVKISPITNIASTITFSIALIIPLIMMQGFSFYTILTYLGLVMVCGVYFYCYNNTSDLQALREMPLKYTLHTMTDLIILYSTLSLALNNSSFVLF